MNEFMNTEAAEGGLWHQEEIIRRINLWRTLPSGTRLVLGFWSLEELRNTRTIEARLMENLVAKPDFKIIRTSKQGQVEEILVSAKLISAQMTASTSRPNHHAARVRFEEAHEHGLLPDNDIDLKGLILSHFIDGESLSRREAEEQEKVRVFYQSQWGKIIECALAGLRTPKAEFLLISTAHSRHSEQGLEVIETKVGAIKPVVEWLAQTPVKLSNPREGQVGTIGNEFVHLQRGQALSLGAQKDIQIKMNAQAIFDHWDSLPEIPG